MVLQILDSAPTSGPRFARFAVRWQRNAILRQGVRTSIGRGNLPSFRAEPTAAPMPPRIQTQSGARRSSGPPVPSRFIPAVHIVHDRLPPRLALAIRAAWIVPGMDLESPRTNPSRALPRLPTPAGTQAPPQAGHCSAAEAPGVRSGGNGMKPLARRDRIAAANHRR